VSENRVDLLRVIFGPKREEVTEGWKICRENTTWRRDAFDVMIILKRTLKKEGMRVWTEFIWLWLGSSGSETSGPIKDEEFIEKLRYY
jgi:hypothetical protein